MANVEKGWPFNYKTQFFLIVIIIVNFEKGRPFSYNFFLLYLITGNTNTPGKGTAL